MGLLLALVLAGAGLVRATGPGYHGATACAFVVADFLSSAVGDKLVYADGSRCVASEKEVSPGVFDLDLRFEWFGIEEGHGIGIVEDRARLIWSGFRGGGSVEQFDIQVQRATPGNWVTLVTDALGSSGAETSRYAELSPLDLNVPGLVGVGGAQLDASMRIVDSTNDGDALISIDIFYIETFNAERFKPILQPGAPVADCGYQWYVKAVRCEATRVPTSLEFEPYAPYFRWWLENPAGEMVSYAEGTAVALPVDDAVRLEPGYYRVTVQALRRSLLDGQDASATFSNVYVLVDDAPLVLSALLLGAAAAVGVSLVNRSTRRSKLRRAGIL